MTTAVATDRLHLHQRRDADRDPLAADPEVLVYVAGSRYPSSGGPGTSAGAGGPDGSGGP